MMNNLFSIFDPSESIMNTNWLMATTPIILMTYSSKKSLKNLVIYFIITKKINKELDSMLEKSKKQSSLMMMSWLFFIILMLNSTSLIPFNFTLTSQISLNFPMAFSLWLSFLILGWSKKHQNMTAHLVPTGTPNALLPMMVLIELTSQLIRPITLSVRLTANMVAGHLLMLLLSEFAMSSNLNFLISSPLIMILSLLEMCVSVIQAYVLMTLLTLYSTEIN